MQTDPRGQSKIGARTSVSADGTAGPRKPPLQRAVLAVLIVVLLGGVLFAARHAVAGFALTRALGALTGERISFRSFVLGRTQSAFGDLSVTTARGEPLFDAAHVGLRYSLHDLVWGGQHRFGLTAVSVERPTLTIVRHADGSYNLGSGSGTGGGTSANGATTPLRFAVRLRDGTIRLLDRLPVAPDLAEQDVRDIAIDARIASLMQSRATARGTLIARRTAGAALAAWPLALAAVGDTPRGIAVVRTRAAAVPLRAVLGFVQHSSAMRADDGLLGAVNLRIFSLKLGLGGALDVHVGGTADVRDGRLTVAALRAPVRALAGRLTLTDDGIWSRGLTGTLAGMPLAARGGAFARIHPVVRLGIAADGDLRELRSLFAFSRSLPVTGPVHVETLIESPVSNILIRSALRVAHGAYGAIPVSDVAGRVDYHASAVVLDGIRARYGAATVGVGGRFLLGGGANSAIAVTASGAGRALPYAENLAPEARVALTTVFTGAPGGYGVRGAIGLTAAGLAGRAMFAVDRRGVGEFGPFRLERRDGSTLAGAFRLERPTSRSAAWVSAQTFRVEVPARAARLPGVTVPAFPPISGVITAALAGGGTPGHFGLVGSLSGRDLRAGGAQIGVGRAHIGGTLADARLSDVELTGPLGRFSGTAASASGSLTLAGSYGGSLEQLVPLTGKQLAHGTLEGPVRAQVAGRTVIVQSTGARLRGGSLRGVAIDAAAGTITVRGGALHVVAAQASIGGRRAVARESNGSIALSAPDLPSGALHATGLPLEAGNVSVFGLADLRGRSARFDGTVAVATGRARGYGVSGDAQIDVTGTRARIVAATGALGSTFGSIGGSIDGIGESALRYDLATRVPLGDVDRLRRDLGLSVRHLEGSFAADLHVYGAGARPFVHGTLTGPEGRYNGLAFRDASARLAIDAGGVAAQAGRITIGSTRAAFAGATHGGYTVSASAPAADLADFNDFFDASDTLAGQGRFDLALRSAGGRLATRGRVDVRGLRFRSFPLGHVRADWSMNGAATIAGQASVESAAGSLVARARIVPAGAPDPRRAFQGAGYDVGVSLNRIDLATWLPAAGLTLPVSGLVNAQLQVGGRFPRLTFGVNAALDAAIVAGFPVRSARLRATSVGTRVSVAATTADVGFAQLSGNGSLGLGRGDPLAFDLRVSAADIGGAVRRFIPAAHARDVAGALDADVRLGGTRARPTVAGGFDLSNARYGGFAVPRAIGELALAGRAIELRDADVEFTRGQAFVAGSLPLELTPLRLGPAQAPLSFDVTARGVDLAQFVPLLPAGTKLGGTVDGRFGVEGTVDRPRLLGSLSIADGSYLSKLERAPIQHFNARLAFAGTSVALETFHAGVGTGTLDAGGRISLPFGGDPHTSYALDLRADSAQLDFPAYGRGTIDGRLQLTGGAAPARLTGEIALRDAVIPVAAVYGSAAGPGGLATGSFPIDPAFAITARVGNNVRVRSSIVDIGVTGALDVTGSLRAPKLAGALSATDGTLSSYNHVFRLLNASATFDPADGTLPTITARALARVSDPDPDPSRNIAGSANIIVTVNGTPDSNNLQVAYSSDPPYSQEQIVGLLLDVPALLGALNFNLNGGPGSTLLRGAPGETNVLLPPGISPEQVSAISFDQEVFSLLNGQFTQRALTPVERVFEKIFGLSDVEFTVDYGGGLGYSLRRQIGKRDFYAFLSQTVTYPERSNFGFELEPKPFETVNFSYYQQNGVTSLITNQTPGASLFSGSTRRYTSVQPLGNRSGFSLDFTRRF